MDALLHPGLETEVVSILDDNYSVSQSLPGYYCYDKLWDGGPIPRSWTEAKDKSGIREWHLKVQLPCFQIPPYFWTPESTLLCVFEGLSIIRTRGTKIQAITGISHLCGLVKQPHGCLYNQC